MKKPNQIVDPILNVVYPPPEAVVPQLYTIRQLALATIKMYESTNEIRTIQPNLNMMQQAIDYLRGQPLPEDSEDPNHTEVEFVSLHNELQTKMIYDQETDTYNIEIIGTDVAQKIHRPELFGDITSAVDVSIFLPLDPSKEYIIIQQNPALAFYYGKDENVVKTEMGEYIKSKKYREISGDGVEYGFLLSEGQTHISITVSEVKGDIIYDIEVDAHVHFKAQEDEGV